MTKSIVFGEQDLSIEDIWNAARCSHSVCLSRRPDVIARLAASSHIVAGALEWRAIYGVNTGYGDSCVTNIPPRLVAELPLHLARYHGCGSGRIFDAVETRAVMAVRLASLVRGWSGVRVELLELLADMLQNSILPLIPAEGSVGASGDLTPLSYLAAAMSGERNVRYGDEVVSSSIALEQCGLQPIRLAPKEALAIMNGTAVMTGLAVIAIKHSETIARLASRLTAMTSLAILGNPAHFDERLAIAKPHPGQIEATALIRNDLGTSRDGDEPQRLQDRYSVRCAPHVIGVLMDFMPSFRRVIETEINSANDNPLFDPESGRTLHGGHFYGGHVAFAMDGLKTLVAKSPICSTASWRFWWTRYNNGLPPNSPAQGDRAPP